MPRRRRRLPRILLNAATVVSLLVACLVLVSWVDGRGAFVWFEKRPHGPRVASSHAQAAAVALCLPTAHLGWAIVTRRKRPRPGLCPACGYDLRATPARCPECGAAPPRPPRSS